MAATDRGFADPNPVGRAAVPKNSWGLSLRADGKLLIALAGAWVLASGSFSSAEISHRLAAIPMAKTIAFDVNNLAVWDSVLIDFLDKLENIAGERGIVIDWSGLPGGVVRLVALARAVPEHRSVRRSRSLVDPITRVGVATQAFVAATVDFAGFVGEAWLAIGRLMVGRARVRAADCLLAIEDCGPSALPITALVNFLVGLILAFVGAIELRQFGASIYVANLVGVAMVREMGAMMTAILMAGRTGGAYAANLGTMQVSDEISALQTLGIAPMEFLVLPRILALVAMMPLLAVFANVVGMFGGLLIARSMLGITPAAYYHQTSIAVGLTDWAISLVKATAFGAIVAVVGCWRGMRCGRSAVAVGAAATSAVVLCIVLIIAADAIATVICNTLDI
jgi:phospholipid/cholesterol/gamma-HCH transport system permease protein